MDIPTCIACGEKAPERLEIMGETLCPACEAKLVKVRVEEGDYQYWIDCCRRLWEQIGVKLDENDAEK